MHRQDHQEAEQTTAISERLLAALDEIELLHEQVEFWRELVESLNLELQQTEQELQFTNQELCTAVMIERVSLHKAKTLAKIILKSEKSGRESLAELLTAIYGCSVKSEELQQIDRASIITTPLKSVENNRIVANLKELNTRSQQLQEQYKKLELLFSEFKAYFTEFKKLFSNLTDESRRKDRGNNNHYQSNCLSYSPPPPKKFSKLRKAKKQQKSE